MNDSFGIGLKNHQEMFGQELTSRDRSRLFGEQLHLGLLPLYRIKHSSDYLAQEFAGGTLHSESYDDISTLLGYALDNSLYRIHCGKSASCHILCRVLGLYSGSTDVRQPTFETPDASHNSVYQGQEVAYTIGKCLEFYEQDSERYRRVYSGEVIPVSENGFRSIFFELRGLGVSLIGLSSTLLYGNKNKKSTNKEEF